MVINSNGNVGNSDVISSLCVVKVNPKQFNYKLII